MKKPKDDYFVGNDRVVSVVDLEEFDNEKAARAFKLALNEVFAHHSDMWSFCIPDDMGVAEANELAQCFHNIGSFTITNIQTNEYAVSNIVRHVNISEDGTHLIVAFDENFVRATNCFENPFFSMKKRLNLVFVDLITNYAEKMNYFCV